MDTNDMHRAEIIARVKIKTGLSMRKLSLENGLNEQSCKAALSRPYLKPEQVISDAIGIPAHVIWPSRYNMDGSRKQKLHASKQMSTSKSSEATSCKLS